MPSAKGFGSNLGKVVDGDVQKVGSRGGKLFGSAFVRTSAGPIRAGIGGIGKAAAGVFAGLAVGSFFKDAVSGSSDLAESASKVNVVFRRQAPIVMKTAQTSATAMGLSRQAYLEATGTLGNLLVSLDLAPKKAAGMSQKMVALAGDLASFNNVSPEEALDALRSGLTGETEPLKRFGVNMNDATLKAQALRMGLIKNTKEALTPQQKALAATRLIMQQTQTAQGDFARTSGGLANQQRILAAQVVDLKARIGGVLLPVVTQAVSGFSSFTKSVQSGKAEGTGFAGFMSQLGVTVKTQIIPAIQQFGAMLQAQVLPRLQQVGAFITGTVVPALVQMGAFIKRNADFFGPFVAAILAIVAAIRTWMAVQAAINFLVTANPIGIVVVALAALVAGLVLAYKRSETFRNIVNTAFDAVKKAGGVMKNVLVAAFKFITSAFLNVASAIINGAARAFGWVPGLGGKLKAAADQFNTFKSRVEASLSGMGAAGQRAGAQFTAGLAAGIRSGGNVAVATAQGVANKITAAVNSAKGFDAHSPSKKGIQSGKWLIEGVAVGIDNASVKGVAAAQKMADRVSKALENRLSKAVDRLRSLQDKAKAAFDTAAGGVRGFLDIGQIGASVETQVTTPGATFIDAVTGAISKTEDLVTTLSRVPSPAEVFAGFAANAQAFAQALADMARKKYPISLISAIAGSGNIAAAQALASASPADTASVIAATKQIDAAAGQAGALVQNITVDPKLIASAQKQVAQLTAQNKQLDRVINLLQDANAKKETVTATIRAGDLAIAVAQGQKQNARRG